MIFPKLPPELRRMIWRAALPRVSRIVHVQQKWIDYHTDEWFAGETRPTRTWEDENGDVLTLHVGIDAYGTNHKQGQLERFGFTSSTPTPMLDSHELYTGEHFHDYLDDKWLYSTCHSSVETLAQTCSESRAAVKSRYELAFSNRFGPARIWFNFEADVLFLSCEKYFFRLGYLRHEPSPFNMPMFDLSDLRRVKQLAVQYPRMLCRQTRSLEEAVRYAKNLDHLYLVEGDFSEFDRSNLTLIQFDHAARGCQYMYDSWDCRQKVEKYLNDSFCHDTLYDTWIESVETDLDEFFDECIGKGELEFQLPNLELVSVVGSREYHYLTYWTEYIQSRQYLNQICASERGLEDALIADERKGLDVGHQLSELQNRRAARHIQQMVDEAEGFENSLANQAQAERTWWVEKMKEDFRIMSQYEAELEHEELSNPATDEFEHEMICCVEKMEEDFRMLSQYEAELEQEEMKFEPASDEFRDEENTVPEIEKKTVLDYFPYVCELEPGEAQPIAGNAVALEAAETEDEREAKWKGLGEIEEQQEIEEAYEAECEIEQMAIMEQEDEYIYEEEI